MARVTGQSTPNLSVPTLGAKDNLDKATFNELITRLDTRINLVADETQALNSHEAATTSVHGIADTSDLVVTTDTPADGEVLAYTTAGGVNWASADAFLVAAAAAVGTEVVFAATSQLNSSTSATGVINDWITLISDGATCDGTTITLTETGVYEISYNGTLLNTNLSNSYPGNITIKNSAGGSTTYGGSLTVDIQPFEPQRYNGNFARTFAANDTLVLTASAIPNLSWYYSSEGFHSIVVRKIG